MRLLLKIKPAKFMPYSQVSRHTVQGMIYSLLQGTEFEGIHNASGFKFFSYSNLFPINDFFPKKEKKLIISSPNEKFINTLAELLKSLRFIYLSDVAFSVEGVKTFSIRPTGKFITATPVVVQKEPGKYLSFAHGDNMRTFMERIKENALKKYNAFYDDELSMDGELFDLLQFQKEVSVVIKRDGESFEIVGTLWSLLQKRIPKGFGKFYSFLLDCGLGEKNSMGFGFLNVVDKK